MIAAATGPEGMMRNWIAALMLMAVPASADVVGKVGVDWTGNDILIEAIADPAVQGVTCHLAYFDRSVIDRLSQGNWFEDPSNSAIECSRTGPIRIGDIQRGAKGEDVFSASRSLILKSLRVKRIYDEQNQVLVYLAHSDQLSEGSAKMSISTVALLPEEALPAK
jgi:CreA protein